jgi:hypothetical protein
VTRDTNQDKQVDMGRVQKTYTSYPPPIYPFVSISVDHINATSVATGQNSALCTNLRLRPVGSRYAPRACRRSSRVIKHESVGWTTGDCLKHVFDEDNAGRSSGVALESLPRCVDSRSSQYQDVGSMF